MDSMLIYYPFAIAEKADSGSKLRPKEMIRAFQALGERENIEVYVIAGNSEERSTQFQQLIKKGALERLLFCYAENQTIPLWLTDPNHIPKKPLVDYQVFQYLKKRNVPIGLFYRDVYWKFDELYPLKGLKKKMMQMIYRMEEKFYEKFVDALFLPSLEMGKYVEINRPKYALPPGGKELSPAKEHGNKTEWKAIYVGGIKHPDYGLPLMLESLEKAREWGEPFHLTIVCRKQEYEQISPEEKERMHRLNVEIKHLSGKELDQLYAEMDFALIPRARTRYNDFSVPVKLVEYLSNRLPVIATNCVAQQQMIESGPYGVVCEANALSLLKAIQTMKENYIQYMEKIEATFLEKHSWQARAKTVKRVLLGEEQE